MAAERTRLPSASRIQLREVYDRNGLPFCVNVTSCSNRKSSIVGYPPTPSPRQVPSSQASGAHSGARSAGISNMW